MQVGEFVIVKSFPNEPVVRCVYRETEDDMLICLVEDFKLWEDEGIKPLVAKSPKSRIFQYDGDLFAKLKEAAYSLGDNNLLNALWNQAQRYYSHDKETQHVGR